MVRGNFHGTPSTPGAPEPFEMVSSSEEDNIPIAFSHHGARTMAFDSCSCGGGRSGSHRDDDGNDEGDGVTPDDSFLEELDEI